MAKQICAGLEQAHRQGVIHGDLKAGNVILAESPEGRMRAVITDFGLARIATNRTPTIPAEAPTTTWLRSCSRVSRLSVASDVYALGVLFHVMLTGKVPARKGSKPQMPTQWTPDSAESTRTVHRRLPPGDWRRDIEPLPAPWKSAVSRAMAPLAKDRLPSAAAVLDVLEPRRRVLKVALAAACAAALIAGGRQWRSEVDLTPVRLAVLPFTIAGEKSEATQGMGVEVAERLSGARSKFTVFSPREAERNQATTPEKARKALGATHVLEVQVKVAGGGAMTTTASLVDVQSGATIRRFAGNVCGGRCADPGQGVGGDGVGGVSFAGGRAEGIGIGGCVSFLCAGHRPLAGGQCGQCRPGGDAVYEGNRVGSAIGVELCGACRGATAESLTAAMARSGLMRRRRRRPRRRALMQIRFRC